MLTTKIAGPGLKPSKSNAQKMQCQEACGYGYIMVRCDGKTSPPIVYRGANAAGHFVEALQVEEERIKAVLANPKALMMTPEDWGAYVTASDCHACDKPLDGDSVREHCHITGKYRGAAHNACNLLLQLSPKTTTIPVIFHNLRGYDSTSSCRPYPRWKAWSEMN